MGDTIENKKFLMTNRVAAAIALFLIGATFSATKFYDETKYQELVSKQNRERIEAVNSSLREFLEQELSGFRADWNRDRENQEKRLEKLESK